MRAGVTCRRHTCLRHAANLCECPPAKWRLAFRHSIAQLEELHESVLSRIPDGKATLCSSVSCCTVTCAACCKDQQEYQCLALQT